MKPRIFIYIHYMEIGGAERALLGLLEELDPEKVDIDLHVNQHTGDFMEQIPEYVNLLPQLPEYSAIERPIKDIVKEGHIGLAISRLWAKYKHRKYAKTLTAQELSSDASIFDYVFEAVTPRLRSLEYLGEYDLAISFLCPHHIVLRKVKARKKVCWIHTDYTKVNLNKAMVNDVWDGYDQIISISEDAGKAFASVFPTLAPKLTEIGNILSAELVRRQAKSQSVSAEMPDEDGTVKILSVGRFSEAKRFEVLPEICHRLLDKGLKLKWYIVGYGDDREIRHNIERYGVEDKLILLGKKTNPYPYINACDIYAQLSLYEGKSVTVREAQILCKPPVITNYTTAKSQVTDGVDGRIVEMEPAACAQGVYDFVTDAELIRKIKSYLATHDYGNKAEAQKVMLLLP